MVLMVEGGLRERARGRTYDLAGGSVVFNEAGEVHENEVLCGRARCLNVELRAEFLAWMRERGVRPRESVVYGDARGEIGAIGRLYAAVIDPGSEVEVEEALLGLLGAIGPERGRGGRADAGCVRKAVEMIRGSFPDRPRLATLAREAGVHEAHLCRAFRETMGCTIGEYVRRVRVSRALVVVVGGEGLAEAAVRTGFADQAHMTRTFTREFGRSPGRLAAAGRKVGSRFGRVRAGVIDDGGGLAALRHGCR
jgi:AraC-like DNA-binding protein